MHMTHAPNINNTFQSYPRIGTKPLFPSVSLPGKQHFPFHYTGKASCLRQWLKPSITTYVQFSSPHPTTTITPTRHAPMFLCLTSLNRLPKHWALWGCRILTACRIHAAVLYLYTIQWNCNQGPYTVFHSSMFQNGFKTQVVWIVVWILKSGRHLSPKWPISHCSQWASHLLGVCVSSGKK